LALISQLETPAKNSVASEFIGDVSVAVQVSAWPSSRRRER
jgi:hypothetical protein